MKQRLYQLLLSLLIPTAVPVQGQNSSPKQEFRGAWIATVINLDWPTSRFLSTAAQEAELRTMMQKLSEAGINAVFFQIRSESDAMYASTLEPWSFWLTGQQGRAPEPFFDPLQLAIQLAHEFGMELHAWMNPFRVERSVGNYTLDSGHVAMQHPEWLIQIGSISILNPGIPEARAYIVDVIEDVVARYDVDGIHFDDYFYPYPPNQIDLEDLDAFNTYGGTLGIFDWRRENVNRFVKDVSEAVSAIKPHVKFGISPFGIWKSGIPDGIVGLSAHDVVFADATTWLTEGWIDYLAPQLYWPFGGGQDFGTLAPWWASVSNERHIYPGLGSYRSAGETFSGTLYAPSEIPNQIAFSRMSDGVQGNVHFRAENITRYFSQGLLGVLTTDLYRNKALTPVMEFRELFPPDPPIELAIAIPTKRGIGVTWAPPASGFVQPRAYAVYRMQADTEPDARLVTQDPANLLAIRYETFFNDEPPISTTPFWYTVTSLSANSVESVESEMAVFESTGTNSVAIEEQVFEFESIAPNPVFGSATINYSIEKSDRVSIRVFDIVGREVARVHEDAYAVRGTYNVRWRAEDASRNPLPSGTYFVVLTVGESRITKPVAIVR